MTGDYQVCQVCLGYVRRARPLPPLLIMSSSSSSPTLSTSTAPSTTRATGTSQSDDGFSGRGAANYFFGFLFLFAVILLILVGCGIGTRRRLLAARRVTSQTSLELWSSPGPGGEITPPKFHETTIVVAQAAGWKDVLPLSLAYLSNEPNLNEKSTTIDIESRHSLQGHTTPESTFPAFPRTLLPTLRKTPSNSKLASPPATSLRVVLLIAMPSPRDEHKGDQHLTAAADFNSESDVSLKATPEIQIGVETLPRQES